jgi:hypothetical protein
MRPTPDSRSMARSRDSSPASDSVTRNLPDGVQHGDLHGDRLDLAPQPPKRRLRVRNCSATRCISAKSKSGKCSSTKKISLYAVWQGMNPDMRCSPDERIAASGSGCG